MRSSSKHYDDLRQFIEDTPIIDCHNHARSESHDYSDPVKVIANADFYYISDMNSVSSGPEMELVLDTGKSLEERWPTLERVWKRSSNTGYGMMVRRVLKQFYGMDSLTLEGLKSMQGRIPDFHDEAVYDKTLGMAGIVARLEDSAPPVMTILDGTYKMPARGKLVARITNYHDVRTCDMIQEKALAVGRSVVSSLDEYLDLLRFILTGCEERGAVAVKDQSAYTRTLDYANPTRAEAEAVFNWLMEDPRRRASDPEQSKPLDDFLLHQLIRIARDLELPVQVHTGLLAGCRNDIRAANAAHLIPLLATHRDVNFDLFHANWPYDGELLFLAKNYSNVRINMCWAHIIDPIYCQRFLTQAVSAVPHCKVHGYGSDFSGLAADMAWAHASMARDNITIALCDLIDMEYLDISEAKEIARGWLYDNPKEFYGV